VAYADLRKALPWIRGVRVHAAAAGREAEVRAVLEAEGFVQGVLEGSRIQSDASFFQEAARALAFPEYFGHNWDAFNDCLGDVVFGPAERIAVLWRDADQSLAADAQTVLDATSAFEAVGSPGSEDEDPAQLEIFLFGTGPGFAPDVGSSAG
jgi:RNAse (barnase) inhibitor barstar